jgi:hypothetical protein
VKIKKKLVCNFLVKNAVKLKSKSYGSPVSQRFAGGLGGPDLMKFGT